MSNKPTYPTRPPELGDQPDWPLGPVDFSDDAPPPPPGYRCLICKAHGVRLWREYNCIATAITLHCFDCAILKNGGKTTKPYAFEKGTYTPDDGEIAGLVVAIPTTEGDTFWGYSSVPAEGIVWWRSLAPRPGAQRVGSDKLRVQRDQWRDSYETLHELREIEKQLLHKWIRRTEDLEARLTALGQNVDGWRP
jgi:hypothetical protein